MSKLKVLQIHTMPVITGSGITTILIMTGLDRKKYDVEFACAPGGPLVNEVVKQEIKYHPIKHLVQRISIIQDLLALAELTWLMKKQRYDIIHTHNSKAGFIGRLAGKIAGVRIIVHNIHGFAFHEFEKPPRRKLFIHLERFAAKFTDKLITVSEPLREWGLKLAIGNPEKYVTIYSGIDLEKFDVNIDIKEKKLRLGIEPEDKVIGVVSKLWEGKGHECILQAARDVIDQVPDVKFVFVGEGYLRKKLESLARKLDLSDHVIFTGFRTDIPEITATFDIALLASFFEGLGRVLLEAMALGKPVIASRVGGIVDVVDDGKTGILVSPGNSASLAEAMIRLLRNDGLRIRMGNAGRARIDAKFSAKTMINQIQMVYNELSTIKSNTLKK